MAGLFVPRRKREAQSKAGEPIPQKIVEQPKNDTTKETAHKAAEITKRKVALARRWNAQKLLSDAGLRAVEEAGWDGRK